MYRIFPITFTINLCESLNNNDFGIQNLYSCGNLTKCPFTKVSFCDMKETELLCIGVLSTGDLYCMRLGAELCKIPTSCSF